MLYVALMTTVEFSTCSICIPRCNIFSFLKFCFADLSTRFQRSLVAAIGVDAGAIELLEVGLPTADSALKNVTMLRRENRVASMGRWGEPKLQTVRPRPYR